MGDGRADGASPSPDYSRHLLRSMERMHARLDRALGGREFESEEAMNEFLQRVLSGEVDEAPRKLTPLEQAQELIFDAWEEPDAARRIGLARQALRLSRDCTDAYVILAEEAAGSPEESRELYRLGVAAGERVLGKGLFEEQAGYFWGIASTRPYMRARFGLAQCLWLLGEREAAVSHAWELLRLNPSDNQAVRYILCGWLLALDRDDDAMRLLDQFADDQGAYRLFNDALLRYRRLGDTAASRAALRRARAHNPFVEQYLLGRRRLPATIPGSMGFGDDTEAICYADDGIAVWEATPGALDWLHRQTVAEPRPS